MFNTQTACATLVDLLRWRAHEQPERLAYTFRTDEDDIHISYEELDKRARALAARLQTKSGAGERALLLYPPGLDYIVAFYGCLYAGVVAVPAYPPRMNGNLGRLEAVIADAQATYALTTEQIQRGIERRFADTPGIAHLQWLATDEPDTSLADAWQMPIINEETLAFLQYTSGSTATPKGVMLTHGNLMHNLKLIGTNFGTSADSRGVVWLPPYHDMGLIGGILQPLFGGYPMTLMAPVDFIQSPLRWLQAISQTKATVSGGPNFAFDLCVQKITPEQRDTLDLSAWSNAFTGAEPIRHETLERFADFFAPCGFRKEAFYPCYGLAEGTLFVAGGEQTEAPVVRHFQAEALERNCVVEVDGEVTEGDRTLVSSGRQRFSGQRIEIVDAESGIICDEEQVGEIWVAGPSVAQGYWNRVEQTEQTFGAYLADSDEGPFLRTGDLGFVRDGELYITGRLKDLIIIRGRNYYPQDIEFAVQESHVALPSGFGAAVSVEIAGEERLVIVQEIDRQFRKANLDEVMRTVRQTVAEQFQLQVYAVVLIKPASIPKTSSGKIQRHACRDRFLAGTLDVVASHVLEGEGLHAVAVEADAGQSADAELSLSKESLLALPEEARQETMERWLLQEAAQVLKVSTAHLDVAQPLAMTGLDSIMAVELKNRIEESIGVQLPLVTFLEGPSVAQLANAALALATDENAQMETGTTIAAMESGDVPLSYGQRALWFLQRMQPESTAYNISHAVRIAGELDAALLQ
ncbi:MAG: AMP-binding protein, partial [Tumebacillaceae bacterium]